MKNIIHHKSSANTTTDISSLFAENMDLLKPVKFIYFCSGDKIRQRNFKHVTEKSDPTIMYILFYAYNSLIIWCKWSITVRTNICTPGLHFSGLF